MRNLGLKLKRWANRAAQTAMRRCIITASAGVGTNKTAVCFTLAVFRQHTSPPAYSKAARAVRIGQGLNRFAEDVARPSRRIV
jgi:hypothetical protein